MGLGQEGLQLFVPAVDDILFLEIRGELHAELGDPVDSGHEIAPGSPGVPAASHRAVGDMDHVADGAPDHPFGAGIGAAAGGHDTRDRLPVGLDTGGAAVRSVGSKVRRPFLSSFLGIGLQSLVDDPLGEFLGDPFYFFSRFGHDKCSFWRKAKG